MARPLRIEYPDAWYHIMNRGRRAERIFTDRQDFMMLSGRLFIHQEAVNLMSRVM